MSSDCVLTETWWDDKGFALTVRKVTLDVTFATGGGVFISKALSHRMDGYLLRLVTNPSAVTAPQDDYDITLTDADGKDVLQSVGLNRDTANTEDVPIVFSGTTSHPVVSLADELTLAISGNNVPNAKTQIQIWWTPTGQ